MSLYDEIALYLDETGRKAGKEVPERLHIMTTQHQQPSRVYGLNLAAAAAAVKKAQQTHQMKQGQNPQPSIANPQVHSNDRKTAVQSVKAQSLELEEIHAGNLIFAGNDPKKIKLIQQRLVLLLHGLKCRNFGSRVGRHCSVSHCGTIQNVLNHIPTCQAGQSNCAFSHCSSSRYIISHWKECSSINCQFCLPLRSADQSSFETINCGAAANQTISPSTSGTKRAYDAMDVPSPNDTDQGARKKKALDSGDGNPTSLLKNQKEATKEWHHSVTQDLRNDLMQKLVKAISSTRNGPSTSRENLMTDKMMASVKKAEGGIYEIANSLSHYYRLLAQKIYEIHESELEEKKRKEKEKKMQFQAVHLPGSSIDISSSFPSSSSTIQEENPEDLNAHLRELGILGLSDKSSVVEPEARRRSVQRCVDSLVHACRCRDASCQLPSCQKMKRVTQHVKICKKKTNGGCSICQQLVALCVYHCKHCSEQVCAATFCSSIKQKLKQQELQQRLQQAQLFRRRMMIEAMKNRTNLSLQAVSPGSSGQNVTMSMQPPHQGIDLKPDAQTLSSTVVQVVKQIQAEAAMQQDPLVG